MRQQVSTFPLMLPLLFIIPYCSNFYHIIVMWTLQRHQVSPQKCCLIFAPRVSIIIFYI